MRLPKRVFVGWFALALALTTISASAAGAATAQNPAARPGTVVISSGTGHGVPVPVNVRAAAAGPQITPRAWSLGPLGRDGKVAGSTLPSRPSTGSKTAPAAAPAVPGGPNSGPGQAGTSGPAPQTPPGKTFASFRGMTQGSSSCGTCQPPDPSAAASSTEIAHTVNLRLQVYSKSGSKMCAVGLNTLAGTTATLSDPRIQFDNVSKRFSMVFIPVPASDTTAPSEYLLASKTSDACGGWWVYHLTFSGSLFPAGTLLDYPYLGQDNDPSGSYPSGGSILSSSNNFCCNSTGFASYLDSAAFAIPKYPVYHGLSVSFPAFQVAFSTAPVTVAGKGTASSSNTYWLASVPGSGYDLYVMTHSSQPGTTMTLKAAVSAPFSPPSRRVNQPGTTQTLDPLDGRIVWAPEYTEGFIWFTHGIDLAGFPAVRYGAISVSGGSVTTAIAYHSSQSDDFNPSLAVTPAGGATVYAWLNWAYTNTAAGTATSVTVNGLLPGAGVPNETGTDRTLIHGSPTSTNFRFGDFSSVEVDPAAASSTCPAGRTAVLAQQYFTSTGNWTTRIARVAFC